jgi:hypothetical protein
MFTFIQAVVTGSPLGRIYATTNKPYYVRSLSRAELAVPVASVVQASYPPVSRS